MFTCHGELILMGNEEIRDEEIILGSDILITCLVPFFDHFISYKRDRCKWIIMKEEGGEEEVIEGDSRMGNRFELGEKEDDGLHLGFEKDVSLKRLKNERDFVGYFYFFILYKWFN